MRVYDNGSCYTVYVSAHEVSEFKRTWPASGLPCRAMSFQFEKASGDLVDANPPNSCESASALLALSQDAQAYGLRRINRKGNDNEPV